MTILCVDDLALNRRIVRRCCEGLGHTVIEMPNGTSALDYLDYSYYKVSLIILDWNMPRISGLEVLKQVKSNPLTHDIVVMMLTVESDIEYVRAALAAGAQDFMLKPVDLTLLASKIHECEGIGVQYH